MTEAIIEIRELKKYYDISQKKSISFVDLPNIIKNKRSKCNSIKKVLDGINLDIYEGECFGIIGPNGTGKSTLLRLISGIIPPDSGSVKVKGSLIPLLTLGVGFSDDLNAHDNVYQYGMILGFSKKEMDNLYDDIIAFSGLEQYQYMLLQNFSSGMRVKLAFATAAQIQPDILVLDEVLSVGDISFKEKSRQKILDFCGSDKTVVIVSHSMGTIADLCDRAMFLYDGKIRSIGSPSEVIDAYIGTIQENLTISAIQENFKPKEIAFGQALVQRKANQEKDQEYVHQIIHRLSELKISPLIRSHYNSDVERILNEYLTWENLRKVSHLEEVLQAGGEDLCEEDTIFGSSIVSFLKKFGDESESRAVAIEIIRNHCKDGFIFFGNDNLTAFISGKVAESKGPVRIGSILVCDGSRIIPVIFDANETIRIDHRSALSILEKTHCEPENGTTLVLSPETFTDKGIATLVDNSIRFLAPVQVQDIEKGNIGLDFFKRIVSPDNMLIFNDRPIFTKKGQFDINGNIIDGYGYFTPHNISKEYTAYFKKLEKLKNIFETTSKAQSTTPDVLITDIAKRDAIYFSGTRQEDHVNISFNYDSILKRQKLLGMVFLYHSGTWDAEACYRNYEIWRMTEQSFNFYHRIVTSDNALDRGKALVSLINTIVRFGIYQ
jgi:ABC-type polysaccharide/polyol phosphate transport system ATPase subunit